MQSGLLKSKYSTTSNNLGKREKTRYKGDLTQTCFAIIRKDMLFKQIMLNNPKYRQDGEYKYIPMVDPVWVKLL